MPKPSSLEQAFGYLLIANGLYKKFHREYRFHPDRRWKFDYADPLTLTAVELEGGIWTQGRHVRGKGVLDDMEKYNTATAMGWKVFRYASENMTDFLEHYKQCIETKKPSCLPKENPAQTAERTTARRLRRTRTV